MTSRSTFVRSVTLLWASLQLAAPAMSSIADGQLSRDNATQPTTHVEATTTGSCPVVHPPDCAVCRYLSTSGANDIAAPSFDWQFLAVWTGASTVSVEPGCGALGLPRERAPPGL